MPGDNYCGCEDQEVSYRPAFVNPKVIIGIAVMGQDVQMGRFYRAKSKNYCI
jgi:hypothetical protein